MYFQRRVTATWFKTVTPAAAAAGSSAFIAARGKFPLPLNVVLSHGLFFYFFYFFSFYSPQSFKREAVSALTPTRGGFNYIDITRRATCLELMAHIKNKNKKTLRCCARPGSRYLFWMSLNNCATSLDTTNNRYFISQINSPVVQ